jgi:hypothetical protein
MSDKQKENKPSKTWTVTGGRISSHRPSDKPRFKIHQADALTLASNFRSLAKTFRGLLTKQWHNQNELILYCSDLDDEVGRLLIYACTKGFIDSPKLQLEVTQYLEEVSLRPRPTLRPSCVFQNTHCCNFTEDFLNIPYQQLVAAIDGRANACERVEFFLAKDNGSIGQADEQAPPLVTTANDDNKWYHKPTDPRPTEYKYGPITGTKKEICTWMGESPNRNMRRLAQRANNNTVWVIRLAGKQWEVWFKDDKTFQDTNRNRCYGLIPTQKTT